MGQTPFFSIQNGPSKGFLESPQDHNSWEYFPSRGGMEGGLRVKGLLVVGGRGGSSLSLSLHGFLLPMSKEKPIQPQIGPGSAILNCPEGVQILFVDGTNGVKGKGSSLPFSSVVTQQGGGLISHSEHLQKVLRVEGMDELRRGVGGSVFLL